MIVETQTLAPNQPLTFGEFLLELENVRQEFESIRPSRLRLISFRDWRTDRSRKIAEIAKKYVEAGCESVALIKASNIRDTNSEIFGEAGLHLIRATCAVKEKNADAFKHDFDKIFRYEKKDNYIEFIFVLRIGENAVGFSERYKIPYRSLTVFNDVPEDKVKWFKGEWDRSVYQDTYVKNFELHVHSEDEIKFLLTFV